MWRTWRPGSTTRRRSSRISSGSGTLRWRPAPASRTLPPLSARIKYDMWPYFSVGSRAVDPGGKIWRIITEKMHGLARIIILIILLSLFQLQDALHKAFFYYVLKLDPDPHWESSWIWIWFRIEKNNWIRICKNWVRIHNSGRIRIMLQDLQFCFSTYWTQILPILKQ